MSKKYIIGLILIGIGGGIIGITTNNFPLALVVIVLLITGGYLTHR